MNRSIDDVLDFRNDISPFLVHLTRKKGNRSAKKILSDIISSKKLLQSGAKISDTRFGCTDVKWDAEKVKTLFSAICFTETPLNEIHCLLEIKNRTVQLEPYGLVFLKKNLRPKNISPVLYLNNYGVPINDLLSVLGNMVTSAGYPKELNRLFPLFSSIGKKLTAHRSGIYDFSWEREWRLPYCFGDFDIDFDHDVFIGLCPHTEIDEFEKLTATILGKPILFIDPRRNAKWYAKKLIDRRRKFKLTVSVV